MHRTMVLRIVLGRGRISAAWSITPNGGATDRIAPRESAHASAETLPTVGLAIL